jgi:hypothetical protein
MSTVLFVDMHERPRRSLLVVWIGFMSYCVVDCPPFVPPILLYVSV